MEGLRVKLQSLLASKLEAGVIRLSEEELTMFKKWATDACLERSLQANAFMKDTVSEWELLELTATQVIKTVKWRVEFGVEQIEPSSLESVLVPGEVYLSPGRARHGQPVFVNIKSAEKQDYSSQYVTACVYLMEMAIKGMDNPDCSVQKWIVLTDLNSWSPVNMLPINIARELVDILQNHYRERLEKVYVMNAPWYFSLFWNIVSPLMDPDTKTKISFVGAPSLQQKGGNLKGVAVQDTSAMNSYSSKVTENTGSDDVANRKIGQLSDGIHADIDAQNLEAHFGGRLEYKFDFYRDVLNLDSAAQNKMRNERIRANSLYEDRKKTASISSTYYKKKKNPVALPHIFTGIHPRCSSHTFIRL